MNPFAFGENSDFLISAHQVNDVIGHNLFCIEWFQSPCRILVISTIYFLPHTIFKLTSKGKEMVFWRCIFRSVLEIVTS